MLKTLIADDNMEYLKKLMNNVIIKIDDIQVECICTDGAEVMNKIFNKYFDLILLDLQMPKMNGIEIIKSIKTLDNVKTPKVIIISGDLLLIQYADINNVVCDVILKTEGIENIYRRILRTVNDIKYQQNYENTKERTIMMLEKMGYNFKLKGTKYLIDSVMFVYEKNDLQLLDNLEKNIYKFIGKKYGKSVRNIKTNIINSTNSIKNNELTPKKVMSEILISKLYTLGT